MRPAGIGMLAIGLIMYIAYPKFTSDYVDGVQSVGVILIALGILSFLVSLIPIFQQERRDNDRQNAALRAPRDRGYDDRY